jgi:uncharacterized membrane protein YccC
MGFERRRARLGDVAFWLAVVSSTFMGLTLLLSEIVFLLGAPPQQLWFSLMVGTGIALALVCAFAGVVIASLTARRRRH